MKASVLFFPVQSESHLYRRLSGTSLQEVSHPGNQCQRQRHHQQEEVVPARVARGGGALTSADRHRLGVDLAAAGEAHREVAEIYRQFTRIVQVCAGWL